jgi:putative acetyltransferase
VRIRAETPDDVDAIAAVTAAAFAKEREARMVEAIRASDGFVPELSLVADDAGEIVGHVSSATSSSTAGVCSSSDR